MSEYLSNKELHDKLCGDTQHWFSDDETAALDAAAISALGQYARYESTMIPDKVCALIEAECDAIKAMLVAKNRAYGNSALDPVRIFSKADPLAQIDVRIDDKLSRIVRGEAAGEDVELDLIGYLVLKRVAKKSRPIEDIADEIANDALGHHSAIEVEKYKVERCQYCGGVLGLMGDMFDAQATHATLRKCVQCGKDALQPLSPLDTDSPADSIRHTVCATEPMVPKCCSGCGGRLNVEDMNGHFHCENAPLEANARNT